MDTLSNAAKVREARSVWALALLTLLTLGVGVFVSLRVRRLLAPLGHVTERARAVAEGDLTAREVRPGDDEIAELAVTFEDMVGAVARARTEALSNERLAAIGKMAAHVTHEIRNPLSSIGLNVELLEEELAASPERRCRRSRLAHGDLARGRAPRAAQRGVSARRAPSVAEDGGRGRRGARPRRGLVHEQGDGARAVCGEGDGRWRRRGKVPPALFDDAQLRQALLNLLRNARESMPNGGVIDAGVRAEGMSVVVTVDDRGSGISEDVRARIFDPFFSTKGEGTGLGLAITRQIVEAHGGTISCAAREGGGTSFRIALPIAPARAK